MVTIRDGSPSVARLVPSAARSRTAPHRCRRDGTYLVTGGLGDLGLAAAWELVARGARRIVLADDRPFPPRSEWSRTADPVLRRRIEMIHAIEERGTAVRVHNAAVPALAPDRLDLPPVRGVVHAEDPPSEGVLADTVPRVVHSAVHLHTLFPPGTLDFLVLYTRAGAWAGSPGETGAAVAGAVYEAVAGLRASSGADDATVLHRVPGPEPGTTGPAGCGVTVEEAVTAWEQADRCGIKVGAVLRSAAVAGTTGVPPILGEVAESGRIDAESGDREVGTHADLPPGEFREYVLREVGAEIAGEMRLAETSLDHRRPLVEQGLDSVMSVIVRRRLERRFGCPLPATLLWQQPTVTAVADHLVGLLRPGGRDGPRDTTTVGAAGEPARLTTTTTRVGR